MIDATNEEVKRQHVELSGLDLVGYKVQKPYFSMEECFIAGPLIGQNILIKETSGGGVFFGQFLVLREHGWLGLQPPRVSNRKKERLMA
jgi:hypothetical protein